MRLCFVADARSPIAQNWIRYFIEAGHEVHVISSYPCNPDILDGAILYVLPLGLTGLSRITHNGMVVAQEKRINQFGVIAKLLAEIRGGRLRFISQLVVDWLVPLDLSRQSRSLRAIIRAINPDLVHAMRICQEGFTAAMATPASCKLVVSVWGNDFTLWARRNWLRARQTSKTVRRANALHSDCFRDIRLAVEWGFDPQYPNIVVPGAGGIKIDLYQQSHSKADFRSRYGIGTDKTVILNPRGMRGYVRNDVFFQALIEVVERCPNVHVVCTGMKGNPVVEGWLVKYKLGNWVTLLPQVSHAAMVEIFQLSDISVSPSEHDGTPNSLLEAMASGCFVVAGDIESIREWITDGYNGLLCNPSDKSALAQSLILAVQDKARRERAKSINRKIIEERADFSNVMKRVSAFYGKVMSDV